MISIIKYLKLVGLSITFIVMYIGIAYFIGGLGLWIVTLNVDPDYILLPNIYGGIFRVISAICLFSGIVTARGTIEN